MAKKKIYVIDTSVYLTELPAYTALAITTSLFLLKFWRKLTSIKSVKMA